MAVECSDDADEEDPISLPFHLPTSPSPYLSISQPLHLPTSPSSYLPTSPPHYPFSSLPPYLPTSSSLYLTISLILPTSPSPNLFISTGHRSETTIQRRGRRRCRATLPRPPNGCRTDLPTGIIPQHSGGQLVRQCCDD